MERAFNAELTKQMERHVDVFLPQRDGGLMMELVKSGVPPEDAARTVFDRDREAMERSEILVGVLDGAAIDEGVAFEIGYMFGLGKYCVGYQTDMRRALPTGNNPMIGAALRVICDSSHMLISVIAEFVEALPASERTASDHVPIRGSANLSTFKND